MDARVRKQAIKRLAIAEGHLKKVRRMVEEDAYCPHVIHQSKAVQSALKRVDELVLDGHLHSCVVRDVREGNADKALEEIVELFKKS